MGQVKARELAIPHQKRIVHGQLAKPSQNRRASQSVRTGAAWNRRVGRQSRQRRQRRKARRIFSLVSVSRPWGKIFRLSGAIDDPDYRFAIRETHGEFEDRNAENGIQKERQPRDHKERAPVAQLIAKLA